MVIKTGARAATSKVKVPPVVVETMPEPVKREPIKIEPGIIDGLPNADYHGAKDWLGSTSLKTLAMKTPAHYKHQSEHQVFKDEFNIGTAAHSLILENDTTNIVVLEHQNYLTKAAKEAKAAVIADNKQPLLAKEWEQVQAMRDSVMSHAVAGPLFQGHIPERSIFWEEDGMKFKVRPDALHDDVIVDLKSTADADTSQFGKTAYNFGYFVSAALYQEGVRRMTGKKLPFVFVNVEKSPPYLVSVTELDEDAFDFGHMMIDRAIRIFKECTESGVWPGYPHRTMTRLPDWAYWQLEELDDQEITITKGA